MASTRGQIQYMETNAKHTIAAHYGAGSAFLGGDSDCFYHSVVYCGRYLDYL